MDTQERRIQKLEDALTALYNIGIDKASDAIKEITSDALQGRSLNGKYARDKRNGLMYYNVRYGKYRY